MKIAKETELIYDYFSDVYISLNGLCCFFYEDKSSLDRYQLREMETDKIVVCSETKEELIDYLISQNATLNET